MSWRRPVGPMVSPGTWFTVDREMSATAGCSGMSVPPEPGVSRQRRLLWLLDPVRQDGLDPLLLHRQALDHGRDVLAALVSDRDAGQRLQVEDPGVHERR